MLCGFLDCVATAKGRHEAPDIHLAPMLAVVGVNLSCHSSVHQSGRRLLNSSKQLVFGFQFEIIFSNLLGPNASQQATFFRPFGHVLSAWSNAQTFSYRKGYGDRASLMRDKTFSDAFAAAKIRMRDMDYRYVEETDQARQVLLEIYCAVVLGTPYNDFGTH
jgi:hypothetical protein